MFSNPMSPPIVQATKKQRAGGTPDWSANGGASASATGSANNTDARLDTAAKRRAELEKLKSSMRVPPKMASSAGASSGPSMMNQSGPPIMNHQSGPPIVNGGPPNFSSGGPPPTTTGFGVQPAVRNSNGNRNTAYSSRSRLPPPSTQRSPPTDLVGPSKTTSSSAAPPSFPRNAGPPVVPSSQRSATQTTNGSNVRPPTGVPPAVPKSPVTTKADLSSVASPAQATAAALRSPKKSPGEDKVQRKLDFNRSKSAPRERPPAPPAPPILHHEAPSSGQDHQHVSFVASTAPGPPQRPTGASATPFPGRVKKSADTTTSFPSTGDHFTITPPQPANSVNAGRTPFAKQQSDNSVESTNAENAGRTPFHKQQPLEQGTPSPDKTPRPVQTPYPHNMPSPDDTAVSPPLMNPSGATSTATSSVSILSSSSRKDQLESMRAASSTPFQQEQQPSRELRLQRELARSEADRAEAHQNVAKLETDRTASLISDNLTTSVASRQNTGFISPVRSPRFGSTRVLMPTPTPVKKPVFAADRRLHFHKLSVECSAHEYAVDNLTNGTEVDGTQRGDEDAILSTTYTVRRPYGMATEQELWYKCGQKPAKVYGRDANLDLPDSLEVVAKIGCDGSVFVIYGDRYCKHKKRNVRDFTEYDLSKETLCSITYSTPDLGDDQYDLQQLYEGATEVRKYYCAATLSTAAALQGREESSSHNLPPPGAVAATSNAQPPPGVHTDILTEEVKEPKTVAEPEKKKSFPPPPPPPDDSPDVLSMSVTFFFSTIFDALWFVFWTLPSRILVTTFVMTAAVALLSFVWLYIAETDYIAPIHHYSNQACIM